MSGFYVPAIGEPPATRIPRPDCRAGLGLCVLFALFALFALSVPMGLVLAQAATATPTLSLEEAVRFALAHHPALDGATARVAAARAERELAAAARFPSLDVEAQLDRATGNVVAGSSFAMPGLPATSGPIGLTAFGDAAWGTTTALVSTWPLTGLVRAGRVTAARRATERAAEARSDATRIDVAYNAATAYLRVVAASAALRAADASVRRARTLVTSTDALVAGQLRPGADLARARAELADADRDIARAARERAVAEALLSDALGTTMPVSVSDSVTAPGPPPEWPARTDDHPLVVEAREASAAAEHERAVVALEWWPRFDLVGAIWARGSGVAVGGTVAPVMHAGVNPGISNWGVGVLASWPLLGFPSIGAESRRADALVKASASREREAESTISASRRAAAADAAGAVVVAERSRVALEAAGAALSQSTARYGAGLTSVTDVADAQRLLARVEAADALARVEVIATQLAVARAAGDLQALLAAVRAGRAP